MDDPLFPLKCFQFGLLLGLLCANPFIAEHGRRKLAFGVVLTFVSLTTVWLFWFLPS